MLKSSGCIKWPDTVFDALPNAFGRRLSGLADSVRHCMGRDRRTLNLHV